MKLISITRDAGDVDVRVGPFWMTVQRGDEAIIGVDIGPLHSQSSVDLGAAPTEEATQ